jgi:hypothetical protein
MEFDGVSQTVRDRVEFPAESRLVAVTPDGFVVKGLEGLELWQHDTTTHGLLIDAWHVVSSAGKTLAVIRDGELVLVRTPNGEAIVVPNPTGGDWHLFLGTFSPDGRRFAHSVTVKPETRTEEQMMEAFQEVVSAAAEGRQAPTFEPTLDQLVIVDCDDGSVEVVDEPFENAACHPIWSQDGKHIVFGSNSRVLWTVETQTLNVEFVKFANSPPRPLLDVSDLIA